MSIIDDASTQETSLSTVSNDSVETVDEHSNQATDSHADIGEYTEAYTTAIAGGGDDNHKNKKKTASRRSVKRKVRIEDKAQTLVKGGAVTSDAPAKKKRENPLMKTKYRLSRHLRRVLDDTDFKGQKTLSRPEVVKGLWQHIKRHELQTEVNGKRDHIKVSGSLKGLFADKEHIQMFAMNKELSKHLEKVSS